MATQNEQQGPVKNRWTRWYMWLAYGSAAFVVVIIIVVAASPGDSTTVAPEEPAVTEPTLDVETWMTSGRNADLSTTVTADLWVTLVNPVNDSTGSLMVLASPSFEVEFSGGLAVHVDGASCENVHPIHSKVNDELNCHGLRKTQPHSQVKEVSARTEAGELRCERNDKSNDTISTWACRWQ